MKHLREIRFWGASTAAHQVEGHNHNQWSVWERANAVRLADEAESHHGAQDNWDDIKQQAQDENNYRSGRGVEHYERYEEDFAIAAKLNMNALRFSIEWSRIEPEPGQWNKKEIEHYRRYIRALKKQGIEPVVALWHWTMPTWFTDKGGFEKRRNNQYFVRYCQKIMDELGDELTFVLTFNEPNVYAAWSYIAGRWPPNHTSYFLWYRVMNNLAHAHIDSYIAIRSHHPHLAVSSAVHVNHSESQGLIGWFCARFNDYWWSWHWLNRTKHAHDFIGVNYYNTDYYQGLKKSQKPGKQNDLGWPMHPADIEHVLVETARRYKKAIFIAENGVADAKDQYRQWWLQKTLQAVDKAIARGVVVEGYLHWSLLDNFEWDSGYWPQFGLVNVNRKTMKRTIRKSARWYGEQIKKAQK